MKLHRLFRNFFEIHELFSREPKPKRKLKSLEKLNRTRFEPLVGITSNFTIFARLTTLKEASFSE